MHHNSYKAPPLAFEVNCNHFCLCLSFCVQQIHQSHCHIGRTMSAPAHFSLSRATEADLPEIVKTMWLSFPQVVRDLMIGAPTEESIPKVVEYHRQVLREHHHAVWIKVVENSTGKIVGAALWKIYPNAGQPASGDEQPPPWLEGEKREASKKLLDVLNEGRRKANPEGFLREFSLSN